MCQARAFVCSSAEFATGAQRVREPTTIYFLIFFPRAGLQLLIYILAVESDIKSLTMHPIHRARSLGRRTLR